MSEVTSTHLLYAGDSLIFGDAKVEQVSHMSLILTVFEAASGRKSQLFTVNIVPNIQRLAGSLGCELGNLPTTYLGLPLGAKNKSK